MELVVPAPVQLGRRLGAGQPAGGVGTQGVMVWVFHLKVRKMYGISGPAIYRSMERSMEMLLLVVVKVCMRMGVVSDFHMGRQK